MNLCFERMVLDDSLTVQKKKIELVNGMCSFSIFENFLY